MGKPSSLLAEPANTWQIDCMGTLVSAFDYCRRLLVNNNFFLRGYVSSQDEEVVCEMGQAVRLRLLCDKRDQSFCLNPQKGCGRLQKIYARKLALTHYSLISGEEGNGLNCYFSAL